MPGPKQDFPYTVEGIRLDSTMSDSRIEVSDLDRKTTVKVLPHITERVNKITSSLSHDSLDSVLRVVLPEAKGWINSSIEGASTPLTAIYLSKEISYYRSYLQHMNHISEKTLEKETWFNKQLNNLSKLNSKVAELTACSHDPFPASATNIMYDTFDAGTITSMEGVTSGTTPTSIVDGCIAKNPTNTFPATMIPKIMTLNHPTLLLVII